jgi:hypothetical protein
MVWAASDLSKGLSKMTMNDDFKPYVNVCLDSSLSIRQCPRLLFEIDRMLHLLTLFQKGP